MTHWRCFYHIVWSTKNRETRITDRMESVLFGIIREKSLELDAPIHGVNGAEDHIHIAVSIPPKFAVQHWVKTIKGFSSHAVNTYAFAEENPLYWQRGYSVTTFGERHLPFVLAYIAQQKERHQKGELLARLELMDGNFD